MLESFFFVYFVSEPLTIYLVVHSVVALLPIVQYNSNCFYGACIIGYLCINHQLFAGCNFVDATSFLDILFRLALCLQQSYIH